MALFQRRTTFKILEFHCKRRTSTPLDSILQNFIQNTSLLGVQHFLRNKSFIWLLAYLGCVAMSIIQSWSVTVTFFQQKTYHTVTISSKSQMPFPSVTICTNTVLREDFNFSFIPGFDARAYTRLLNECDNAYTMLELKSTMELNKFEVRRYMRTLSDEERFELGLNMTKVLESCTFSSIPCNLSDPNEIHFHNIPMYGNCLTYNPGFNDNEAKYASPDEALDLTFRFPSQGYWLTSRSQAKLALLVHPTGTAPHIDFPEVIDVSTSEILTLVLSLESEMFSLNKRSGATPSCVDDDDVSYSQRSLFYSKKSPYKYSLQSCLMSCKEAAYSECGYIYYYTPVQSKEYERGKKLVRTVGTECKLKHLDMKSCDCPIPCRKTEYRVMQDQNDAYHIPCKQKHFCSVDQKFQSTGTNRKPNEYDNDCRIKIRFRSGVYQKIEEQLSYGLSEYLGILGGNMSLWIGLCIISLLEVVELCIKASAAAFKTSRNYAKNITSHFVLRQRD